MVHLPSKYSFNFRVQVRQFVDSLQRHTDQTACRARVLSIRCHVMLLSQKTAAFASELALGQLLSTCQAEAPMTISTIGADTTHHGTSNGAGWTSGCFIICAKGDSSYIS